MVGSRSCVTVWRYPKKPYHQNHDLNTWPRWGQSHALFTRPARIRCGKELYPKHTENMNKLFSIKSTRGSERSTGNVDQVCFWGIATPVTRKRDLCAPESAHQQWGGSPHRTEHWLSVVEGNCVVERLGGRQPETNCQSINKTMLNTIRPDALASLHRVSEAQNRTPTREGQGNFGDLFQRRDSERRRRNAWGGW